MGRKDGGSRLEAPCQPERGRHRAEGQARRGRRAEAVTIIHVMFSELPGHSIGYRRTRIFSEAYDKLWNLLKKKTKRLMFF